ncbi:MAG: preprotein translocase subunit SecE [Planctomycetota bacterium]|nr:preprotein translocase subunit SecE [Planctomycetota bacterium]
MLIGVIGAYALSEKLGAYVSTQVTVMRFGLPLLVLIGLGIFMFWMVNRPKSADFLIATEGEMKKVSWSSRKEISGSTKVVIITTFILASILFGVDMMFTWLFGKLGIMGGS